jgi:hypothetical protein
MITGNPGEKAFSVETLAALVLIWKSLNDAAGYAEIVWL